MKGFSSISVNTPVTDVFWDFRSVFEKENPTPYVFTNSEFILAMIEMGLRHKEEMLTTIVTIANERHDL